MSSYVAYITQLNLPIRFISFVRVVKKIASGPAAGDDVTMTAMQRFYQTKDPNTFPEGEGQNPMNHQFAAWGISHRDGEPKPIPCTVRNEQHTQGTPCWHF